MAIKSKKYSLHRLLAILSIAYCLLLIDSATAQAPAIEWQKCLGGTSGESGYAVQQATDGGYIVAGYAWSNDGDVSGNHGIADFWVVKLNGMGELQWQKCLGGTGVEFAYSIQQCTDGGYIVAGFTNSNDGDVSGNHGSTDYWVVKLNGSGDILWQKCLGGTGQDLAQSIQQTTDGGYVVAGITTSNDGNVSGNHGSYDYWVVKLNGSGDLLWQKCLGGSLSDQATSIHQCIDGGYILAGWTLSNDGNVSGNHGGPDYWVVKLNDIGELQWQKCLGGTFGDAAYSVQQTIDGNYIVAGFAASIDGDVSGYHGGGDYWVVKLDGSGFLQWQKCLGGSGEDIARSIKQTIDDGFIITGSTPSNDGDVSGNHGSSDYWVVKLSNTGVLQWQKCLGGSSGDEGRSIEQTTDGGYVVMGSSNSNDGDVSGNHGSDYWVVKLQGSCQQPDIPVVNAVPATICQDATATLTITSGNLNGATAWHWYTGSCGGTPIGTGISIMVNPVVTTTYYVRGEGGCASNSTCATKVVTVNPYPDPTIQHTFSSPCYYTNHTFQPSAPILPGATYQWNFGANAIPANATGYGPHVIQYTEPGSKTVKLVIHPNASGAQCPDSSTTVFVITNCPGLIIGKVVDDMGNPIADVNVKLYVDANANGIPDSIGPIRNVNTGGAGIYTMVSLIPNNYLIIQTQPANWISLDDGDTTPDGDVLVNIDSLDNLIPATITINKVDSNNVFVEIATPGNITGNVFDDLNQNQAPDPGEGIHNVGLQLFTDNNANGFADTGTPVASTTTTSSGTYNFLNVIPGHYVLVETTPPAYISIKDFDASADGDVVPNTNMNNDTLPVTIVNGESDSENFFIDGPACSLIVTNTNDHGFGSFRHAAGCAVSGDTIKFHPSLAGEVIEINSDPIDFTINAVVFSELSPRVIIQSSIQDLFHILAGAGIEFHHINIISGLGAPGTGAAFENQGGLKFFDVEIHKNPALSAGAYLIKSFPLSSTTINGVVHLKN